MCGNINQIHWTSARGKDHHGMWVSLGLIFECILSCRFIIFIVCPAARPRVHTLVKASGSSVSSLLVCLATGFYPKHVQMEIRHDHTPVPWWSAELRGNQTERWRILSAAEEPGDPAVWKIPVSVCGEAPDWHNRRLHGLLWLWLFWW